MRNTFAFLIVLLCACSVQRSAEVATKPAIIAYYASNDSIIDNYDVTKLTHIIFSFCHLKGNELSIDNARDSATIRKLVSLKSKNPELKVLLSLGGWGGCAPCSEVFASEQGRREFALSTKKLNDDFNTDGIDLDWEYPAIPGHPGHRWDTSDRHNFTLLVKELRNALGKDEVISFAAGGFDRFIRESIEWDQVTPLIDMVNIMSYDLVHGASEATGHLTALHSSPGQQLSADHAIKLLDTAGVPRSKMIIGAAFYARTWENVDSLNNGLYRPGVFRNFIAYRNMDRLHRDSGFVYFFDTIAMATHAYNKEKRLFATFDDAFSVAEKSRYVNEKGLGGIMFWELSLDKPKDGLLDNIYNVFRNKIH